MASRAKRRAVLRALDARAVATYGANATALDYAVKQVEAGGQILTLAQSLAEELGESVSRNFLSGTLHSLSADATSRISNARRLAVLTR